MRFKYLAAALATSGLVLSALSGSPAYAGSDADRAARVDSGSKAAKAALAKVESLFSAKPAKSRTRATSAARPDATMALRELRLRLDDLSSADRATAEKFFARPTDGNVSETAAYSTAEQTPVCGANLCIHYVNSTEDAPPLTDDPANGIPDQVEFSQAVAENVWNRIVTVGKYKKPLDDSTSTSHGPDGKLDIYLANLGDNGLFGYCTSDDPSNSLEISAFCVVDNDFEEFPPTAPDDALRVTVAHEFFHAVQYAYEWAEDNWLLEQTATWIEDELYDSINDNLFYIAKGANGNPISSPFVPLDRFDSSWRSYGGFVFWKKLTETYPKKKGTGLPNIVREVWLKAANHKAKGASTMALSDVLAKHHSSFGKFFTAWGVGNRFPKKSYSEGKANHYPTAPIANGGSLKLSNSHKSLKWLQTRLFHMTNAYARFTPKNLPGTWKLHVTVNLPNKVTGAHATLTIYNKRGKISKAPISINKKGAGKKTVVFGNGKVKYVELTLTNASNRFSNCYPQNNYSPYTCGGTPKDDNLKYLFKASTSR